MLYILLFFVWCRFENRTQYCVHVSTHEGSSDEDHETESFPPETQVFVDYLARPSAQKHLSTKKQIQNFDQKQIQNFKFKISNKSKFNFEQKQIQNFERFFELTGRVLILGYFYLGKLDSQWWSDAKGLRNMIREASLKATRRQMTMDELKGNTLQPKPNHLV